MHVNGTDLIKVISQFCGNYVELPNPITAGNFINSWVIAGS
jgi:hypothetical protein